MSLGSEHQQQPESEFDALNNQLQIEIRIRNGAQHLLTVFDGEQAEGQDGQTSDNPLPSGEGGEALKRQVEGELLAAEGRIDELERKLQLVGLQHQPPPPHLGAEGGVRGMSSLNSLRSKSLDERSFHDAPDSFLDASPPAVTRTTSPSELTPDAVDRQALDWLERVRRHKNDVAATASGELLQALEGFSALMLAQPPLAHVTSPTLVQEMCARVALPRVAHAPLSQTKAHYLS